MSKIGGGGGGGGELPSKNEEIVINDYSVVNGTTDYYVENMNENDINELLHVNVHGATHANISGADSCRVICTAGPKYDTDCEIASRPTHEQYVEKRGMQMNYHQKMKKCIEYFCVANRSVDYCPENVIKNDKNKLSHVNEGEATSANNTGESSCRDIRTPGLENATDNGKDELQKYIKCVMLIVAGFHNKMELGILDQ